ncbi:hypothetical protein L7F22_051659 [Adiantum nelumboides]|nr:hypothetical protein [Adiantum nelumboides]
MESEELQIHEVPKMTKNPSPTKQPCIEESKELPSMEADKETVEEVAGMATQVKEITEMDMNVQETIKKTQGSLQEIQQEKEIEAEKSPSRDTLKGKEVEKEKPQERISDQPITDVDVHDVLDDKWAENEQARGMPKWLVHTLRDSKLDAPLSSRTRSGSCHASYTSDCYALAVSSLHDVEKPLSLDEAQNSKNWMAAMQSKFDALIENETWTLCDLPLGKKAIGTKWVYKLKRKPDGEIDRYKALVVAKGYAQQKVIDYEETFAPTCCMTTMYFLCALAAHFGWDVHQADILTTFLNGDIFEEVYVTQHRGFVKKGQEDKVCKCYKALYGWKQSPRAWYEKADTHLVKRGFRNSPTESTLYVKREGDVLLIVVLYVDDLLITRPNEGHIAEFKADLNATFKMKDLGPLHHYLGI